MVLDPTTAEVEIGFIYILLVVHPHMILGDMKWFLLVVGVKGCVLVFDPLVLRNGIETVLDS